jgi:peptide/nickel transport system permease protein
MTALGGALPPRRRFVPPAQLAGWVGHPLVGFVVRRVVAGVFTLLLVSMLVFGAVQVLPGNAAAAILGKNATPHQIAVVSREMGLSRPITARYLSWLVGLLHGALGNSTSGYAQGTKITVWSMIGGPLGNTLVLATAVVVCLIPLSMLLAVFAGLRQGTKGDHGVMVVTVALISMPEFVLGSLLTLLFATALGVFPAVSLVPYGGSVLGNPQILVLPVLTLLGVTLGACVRMVRAGMIETLRSDYVKMARLNGLSERRVALRYALRNALAPSVQVFAQNIQYLLGGIIVTENLFNYPGIGTALVNAVSVRDVNVVQSTVVVIAASYIAINILADFIVVCLVPKLRTSA